MIPVAAYCRVSTDRDDQANSFRAQQQYFRDYIRNRPDWQLYEIYADEGITGTSTRKRTQFNRMMADAYAGRFRFLLTKEVRRFSRNILDTIRYTRELKDLGIGVVFLNDRINTLEPEAEMLLSFLASLAQEESRRTSSRVVWGQTRQMEQGVVFGQSLLGYDVNKGVLQVNPSGADIVRLIFHKYGEEQVSTREIARFLTEKGYQTLRGSTQWKASSVLKILKNEKYVGDLVQKKTYTPDYLTHEKRVNRGQIPLVILTDHHEPLVSRELWDLVQSRIRQNNKHGITSGSHSNRYAFSGKIHCGLCGSSFVSRYKYRKNGTKVRRWSCAAAARGGTGACSIGKLVRDDDALQMLKLTLNSLSIDTEALIRNVTGLALAAIREGEQRLSEDPRRIAASLERIQQKKEAVMDSYFSGEISAEDMQAMNQKYETQREELGRRYREAALRQQQQRDFSAIREEIQARAAGILKMEPVSDAFCKTILLSLTVVPDRHMELRLKELPHVFHFQS